jgi:ribosome-binding protein aMBF1 (putative translation factor)
VKKRKEKLYFKDEELLKQIGIKMRNARTDLNMSIEALANECEVDYSQINRMELGKVNFSVSYLSKVAKVLKIKPSDLLT